MWTDLLTSPSFLTVVAVISVSIGSVVYIIHVTKLRDLERQKICDTKDAAIRELKSQLIDKQALNLRISGLVEQNKTLSTTIQYLEEQLAKAKLVSKRKEKEKPKEIANEKESKEGWECVICLESVPMTCFIPCGHISTCVSCAKCMKPACCPICRCKDGRFYSIYNSSNSRMFSNNINKVSEYEKDPLLDKKDLHPEEVVKRKGLIRRFLDRF